MTKVQKIIKYFAISLAILLIVSILSTIVSIISNIFDISYENDNKEYKIKEIVNKIDVLDIELDNSKLTFKYDNNFKVEASNNNILVRERNNKLTIKEKSSWFDSNSEEVIIYLPSNYLFNEVSVENGAGNINIDELQTNKLDFELGAGSINVNNLNVINEASIDTGAGQVNVLNSVINNLELNIGVGKTIINGKLTGTNEIEAGIGELELNLNNSINNYHFIINKGIGEIKINNESVNNDYDLNKGINRIEIDGGIGNIFVNTIEGDWK